MSQDGGYDSGYEHSRCFWGTTPGSLVGRMCELWPITSTPRVLDAGCGEGKNAIFLARKGARVEAIDVSRLAIQNAMAAWDDWHIVDWKVADVRSVDFDLDAYDVTIAYGLYHCFDSEAEILNVISRLMAATRPGGLHLMCAFNDRHQELDAHPDLRPTLLSHADYLGAFRDWSIVFESDQDLHETHPHNQIPHCHSMTRLIAEKVSR